MFADITKENPHHAYLIEGDARDILEPLFERLEQEFGVKREGNPNVHIHTMETLDIKTARDIRERAGMTAFGNGRTVFVICARSVIIEAQNALLKTLEEPGEGTLFFLVVPTRELLLSTVRSRLRSIGAQDASVTLGAAKNAQLFLSGDIVDRLSVARSIHEEDDRDIARDNAKSFLAALISSYARNPKRDEQYLGRLISARKLLFSRAPSLKLILECLAITYPCAVSETVK
jgi:hypothetical protein